MYNLPPLYYYDFVADSRYEASSSLNCACTCVADELD